MPLLRYLQHWLTGRGPCLQVADFVPATHPIRQWADTFPWAALVSPLWTARSPSGSRNLPRGDGPPSRRGSCWRWSC
jgi:hypothetical protein